VIAEYRDVSFNLQDDFKGERTMKIKKAMGIVGMTAIVAVGFILMVGTRKIRAAAPGDPPPGQIEVKIDNFSFGPMTMTVAAGTTVTWTNNDDVPHTVVSDDKTTFRSRALDTGEHFSYTFTKPGKYSYFCSVHPKMVAEVVVQ
jgi:plastocyanin